MDEAVTIVGFIIVPCLIGSALLRKQLTKELPHEIRDRLAFINAARGELTRLTAPRPGGAPMHWVLQSVSKLARACYCTPRYASLIRKGEYVPHPVFYPNLEKAIGKK